MTSPSSQPARFAGLDGLRAVAVVLVVVYHLFPASPLRGGFMGVDVFFVISGFLITSLLMRPARSGMSRRARLVDFWRRRARRLLPALGLVIAVCATAAWMLGGDVLVDMGRQVLGAATFSYNWLAVGAGTDYFSATAPELFRNVWSLSVEEQFYVVWPLLLPLLLWVPGRWVRIAVVVLAAGASAWWMAQLAGAGEITRAYFGTDSHAFGLLLGIALALLLHNMPQKAWMLRAPALVGSVLLGAMGLGAVVWASLTPETPDLATFPGMLLVATFGTVLAIFASTWPGSWFGRAIDIAPLRWIGDRSYGIYLWHWPVLVLVVVAMEGVGPEAGVPLGAALNTLGLTVAASALSYRFVEQPLRRHGFRRALRLLGAHLGGRPVRRFAGLTVVTALVAGLGGVSAAIASAPAESSAERAIREGQEAMEEAARQAALAPPPAPPAEPTPVTGADITAIGDSVMLASAPSLYEAFPGITVDAEVSRSIWAGLDIISGLANAGQLREYVVVALGTNGPVEASELERMAQAVGPTRKLILVNAYAPRDWIPGVNQQIESFADRKRTVWLADWSGAISPQLELLAGDKIHPGRAGGDVFAQAVATAVEQVEADAERASRDLVKAPDGRAPRVPFPVE